MAASYFAPGQSGSCRGCADATVASDRHTQRDKDNRIRRIELMNTFSPTKVIHRCAQISNSATDARGFQIHPQMPADFKIPSQMRADSNPSTDARRRRRYERAAAGKARLHERV